MFEVQYNGTEFEFSRYADVLKFIRTSIALPAFLQWFDISRKGRPLSKMKFQNGKLSYAVLY